MTNREAGARNSSLSERSARLAVAMRPGVILGVAVAGVVGLVGLVQWSQQLMLTGVLAAIVILVLNFVVVATSHWHQKNTNPGEIYATAEDVVRMRRPKARR